jgi:hypothetical protein
MFNTPDDLEEKIRKTVEKIVDDKLSAIISEKILL